MEAVDRTVSTWEHNGTTNSGLTSGQLFALRTRDKGDTSFMLHEGGWLRRLEAALKKQQRQQRTVRCSIHTETCSLIGTDALRAMLRRMRVRAGSAERTLIPVHGPQEAAEALGAPSVHLAKWLLGDNRPDIGSAVAVDGESRREEPVRSDDPEESGIVNTLTRLFGFQRKIPTVAVTAADSLKTDEELANKSKTKDTIATTIETGQKDKGWDRATTLPTRRMSTAILRGGGHAELRVSYVSADFRSHSVGYHMHGLLAAHRRGLNGLQVLCYNPGNMDFVDSPDNATNRYLSTVQWHRVQSSNETRASADETRVNVATMEEALGRQNGKGSYRTQSLFRHSAPPGTVRSEVIRARLAAELRDGQHSDHISAVHHAPALRDIGRRMIENLTAASPLDPHLLASFGDVNMDYTPVGSANRYRSTPYINELLPDMYARAVSKASSELGASYPRYAEFLQKMRQDPSNTSLTVQDLDDFARVARRVVTEQRENTRLKTTERVVAVCDAYYGTPGCMTSALCSLNLPVVPEMTGPPGVNEHVVARHMRSKARAHVAVDLNGRSQGHVQMMWEENPAAISFVYLGAPVSVFDPDAVHFIASDTRSAPPDMVHRTLFDGSLWKPLAESDLQQKSYLHGGKGGFGTENRMAGEPQLDELTKAVDLDVLHSPTSMLGQMYATHLRNTIKEKAFPANDVLGACETRPSIMDIDDLFEKAKLANDMPEWKVQAIRKKLRRGAVTWPAFTESFVYLPRMYHALTIDSIAMPTALCDKYFPLYNSQIRKHAQWASDSQRIVTFTTHQRLFCGPNISSCGNSSRALPLANVTFEDPESETDWETDCPPSARLIIVAFHTILKFEGRIMQAWLNILQRSGPCAVLWLLRPKGLDSVRVRLQAEAAARGIHSKRIVFKGAVLGQDSRETIAPVVASAHVFLDAQIYGTHSTAGDLLASGVPILTLITDEWAGRVAMSMLKALDAPVREKSSQTHWPPELSPSLHLVAHGYAEYEEMAVRLTTNPDFLATLSTTMARRLFNGTDRGAHHVGNNPSSPRLYPNGRPHQLVDYSARAEDLERSYRAAYEWRAVREIAERGLLVDGDDATGASFPTPDRPADYAFGSIQHRTGTNHKQTRGAGQDMHIIVGPEIGRISN
jgi:hypothetical protein